VRSVILADASPTMGCAPSQPAVAVQQQGEKRPVTRERATSKKMSKADRQMARLKERKAQQMQSTMQVAAGLSRLKKKARENIKQRNKELAAAAPDEADSDSDGDLDPEIQQTLERTKSGRAVGGGDSVRVAEEPSSAAQAAEKSADEPAEEAEEAEEAEAAAAAIPGGTCSDGSSS
jgi:hypothetical protein